MAKMEFLEIAINNFVSITLFYDLPNSGKDIKQSSHNTWTWESRVAITYEPEKAE